MDQPLDLTIPRAPLTSIHPENRSDIAHSTEGAEEWPKRTATKRASSVVDHEETFTAPTNPGSARKPRKSARFAPPPLALLVSEPSTSAPDPPKKVVPDVEVSEPFFFDIDDPTEEFCPTYNHPSAGHCVEDSCRFLRHSLNCSHGPSGVQDITDTKAISRKPRVMDELGEGYDKKDPFVDDTEEVKDAIIPEGWTTWHGGFYIGRGPLEIRLLSEKERSTGIYKPITVDKGPEVVQKATGKIRGRISGPAKLSLKNEPTKPTVPEDKSALTNHFIRLTLSKVDEDREGSVEL